MADETKSKEVDISKSTPMPKDQVFFPGKAVVSEKAANALASAAETAEAEAAEAPAPKKKGK